VIRNYRDLTCHVIFIDRVPIDSSKELPYSKDYPYFGVIRDHK